MNKDKQDQDKDIKTFCGLPEIVIGDEKTIIIKGIHLLKPTQARLAQAKEMALEKNLDKVFIYYCAGIYSGNKGIKYTDSQIVKELNNSLQ